MNSKMRSYFRYVPLIMSSAIFLISPVSADCPKTKDKINVEQRASKRWQALIKHDFKEVYSFLSPSVRSLKSYPTYRSSMGLLNWKAAKVIKTKCKDNICQVTLQIIYDHRKMSNIITSLTETWIKDKDEWWLSIK